MADLAREIVDEANRMRDKRRRHEGAWGQIRDYVIPMASDLLGGTRYNDPMRDLVLDNTAEQVHEALAAALVTIHTPANVDWLLLKTGNEDVNRRDDCAAYLERLSQTALAVFRSPTAGFATSQHEKYQDYVGFGQGGSLCLDKPGKAYRFTSVPLGQLLIADDGDGFVDTVYRDFELTARQAFQRWGDKVGEKVVKAANSSVDRERPFRFIHAVYPRRERRAGSPAARDMPLASCYINAEEMVLVAEGGFHVMPYAAPRWRKRAESPYGFGPGHVALPDTKMLQRIATASVVGAEKMIDPAWMLADDGIIGRFRTGNGRLNYFRRDAFNQGDPAKPLLTGGQPQLGEEMMQGCRTRIENAFFKPLLQMVRKDRMTATEVIKVMEEGQRILGPYSGRTQQEDLAPIVMRIADGLVRDGVIGDMPDALRDQELKIEYVSPAAKQQRIAQASGLAQFTEITAGLTALKQDLPDNLNADEIYRDVGDIVGFPRRWFMPRDRVQGIREERDRAQAAEQERVATNEGLEAGANAVRALPALTQALGRPTEALNAA